MHRNIARAYDYLRLEHGRIRAACITILPRCGEWPAHSWESCCCDTAGCELETL